MNSSMRFFFSPLSVVFLSIVFAPTAFAQPQLEPSYEVALHVVVGSNDASSRSELPANLSSVSKQFKAGFPFTSYRVANTFFGRVSNTGNIEYKSVSNIFGEPTGQDPQSFLEWSLTHFQVHQTGLQARNFRFGARVPVRSLGLVEGGRTMPMINYESIGLTVSMLGIPANKPTLIGTLNLPGSAGTIFLVATIRPAEM